MNDWIRGSRWMQGDATASLLPPTYPSTLSRNQGDNDLTKSSCQLKGLTPRQDINLVTSLMYRALVILGKSIHNSETFLQKKNRSIFVFLWFSPEILATCSKTIVYFFAAGIFEQSCRRGTPEG